MNIKKTWIGYIIWGIFGIVLFANIGISGVAIERASEGTDFLVPAFIMFGSVIGAAVLIIVLFKLFMQFLYPRINHSDSVGESSENSFVEIMCLVLCMFIVLLIKVITVISTGGIVDESNSYFLRASNGLDFSYFSTLANGMVVYGKFISMILSLFGEKAMAIYIAQSVLQLISSVLLFVGLRTYFGKLAGWIGFLIMSFAPGNFLSIKEIDAGFLYAFVISLFLFVLLFFAKERKSYASSPVPCYIGMVLCGILCGFLCYMDISGFLFVILGSGISLFSRDNDEDDNGSAVKPVVRFVVFLLTSIIAFIIILFFATDDSAIGTEMFLNYFKQLIRIEGLDFNLLSPNAGNWDCLALLIPGLIWLISYFKSENDNATVFAIGISGLTILTFLTINEFTYQPAVNILWACLASVGIYELVPLVTAKEGAQVRKLSREERKREREWKRSVAAGEKSIRLDAEALKTQESFVGGTSSFDEKKNYGIGRKAGEEVPDSNTELNVAQKAQPKAESNEVAKEPIENIVPPPVATPVNKPSKPVVVERPPVVDHSTKPLPPLPKPVEKKETSHSNEPRTDSTEGNNFGIEKNLHDNEILQNTVVKKMSPARRGFRTPSKSTFSPEELERIRLHTNGEFAYRSPDEKKLDPQNRVNVIDIPAPAVSETKTTAEVEKPEASLTEQISEKPDAKEREAVGTIEKNFPTEPLANENINSKPAEEVTSLPNAALPVPPVVPVPNTQTETADVRKPKLIRNPLPVPKPHVAKELNFDYNPTPAEMDFDLKDLSGKDYFDI